MVHFGGGLPPASCSPEFHHQLAPAAHAQAEGVFAYKIIKGSFALGLYKKAPAHPLADPSTSGVGESPTNAIMFTSDKSSFRRLGPSCVHLLHQTSEVEGIGHFLSPFTPFSLMMAALIPDGFPFWINIVRRKFTIEPGLNLVKPIPALHSCSSFVQHVLLAAATGSIKRKF